MSAEQNRAVDRLTLSRAALVERMRGKRAADQPAHAEEDASGQADVAKEEKGGKWALARHVAGIWWRRHPASIAAELAQPAMAHYARQRPLRLLGYAAAAGAAIAVLRPWRLVPATALLATLLKTSDLAAVAAAMIGKTPRTNTPHEDNP